MTCSSKWREITENVNENESTFDHPDIITRVFNEKVKVLIFEIVDNKLFGKVIAYIFVIEFQKRGFPHIHLLIYLADEDKIRNCEQVDRIVTAEIPDKNKYPKLYELVKQFMIHGPCGNQNKNSPCMDEKKEKCLKNFPKEFIEETVYNDTFGYPIYKRRNNGDKIIFNPNKKNSKVADNRYVVLYNPYLLLKLKSYKC